jgi:hypothetical protein
MLAGLLVLLSAGCGINSTLVKSGDRLQAQDGLLASFDQYWTVRARKEAEASFKLEAPYIQEMTSFNRYRLYMIALNRNVKLVEVEILDMKCEQPFYCTVSCRLVYAAADGRREERNLRDYWVLADGRWSHVLRNPMIFPELGKVEDVERGAGRGC